MNILKLKCHIYFEAFRKGTSIVFLLLPLISCSGKGGSDFNFLDSGSGQADCAITTQFPSSATVKVSGASGTITNFTVGLSADTCTVSFDLNGSPLTTTGTTASINSSALTAGANTLIATTGSTSYTWTITKNTAPACGTQTPTTTGNSMAPNTTLILTGEASDADSDSLSFNWLVNDTTVASSILNTFTSTLSSQSTFTPTTGYLGANVIAMVVSDGTDTTSCNWTVSVTGSCVIGSTNPSAPSTLRIPNSPSATTTFQSSASAGCTYSWTLNGSPIGGATTANYSLTSSDALVGANLLTVAVTNGTSTDSRTWTVVRNTAPVCASQTPASTGSTVGVGTSLNMNATATDANGDSLTFAWFNNGSAVSTPVFTIASGASSSAGIFSPSASQVGVNNIRADITDGYDTTNCSWTVNVVPVCAIASSSPSGSTFKMPNAGASSQNFVATANDGSCTTSWRLNGVTLSGATSAIEAITSSQLSSYPASNTLEAIVSNGYTSATRTWTVDRNDPPVCGSQTPSSTGNSVGVGGTITFIGTVTNSDSDTLSYSWQYNGSAVNTSYFTNSSSGNTAQTIFNPNSSFVGTGHTVRMNFNDGYDSSYCDWTTSVINSCAISSAFPSTTTYKVAYTPATSTTFGVIPSDGSCATTWTMGGVTLGTGALLSLHSSDFVDGPTTNSLVATLDNGVTTPTTRTWSVTKNRVPACSSQAPTSNPPAMSYTATLGMTVTGGDPDGDSLGNFSWKFNGSTSGTLFTPVTTVTPTSTTVFHPGVGQAGTGQQVTCSFDDGYDSGSCSYSFDITNPNTIDILSCAPASNPVVVYSTGGSSTQTLQVVAANASTFQWYQNGSSIGGATSASYAVSAGSFVPGNYSFRGLASDAFGNSDYCDYTVKINASPTISAAAPTPGQVYKMNYGATLGFSVVAADANSDSLSYTWTINGSSNAALPSGSSSTTFNPNSNPTFIGSNTIAVSVSDGNESVSQSWTIEVNYFSTPCNTIMNGSVGSYGGKICTLVGVPGVGGNLDPTADQTLMRVRPAYITDDGSGNLIFSDHLSHTVNVYNRSVSTITIAGRSIAAGKMGIVVGNGSNGITIDSVYNNQFKLDTPMGVAWDPVGKRLWVADYTNHRVALIDNTGLATTVLGPNNGSFQGNTTAYNTDGSVGTAHSCGNPVGLLYLDNAAGKWLYVACSSNSHNVIKKMDVDPLSVNYNKTYIVVGRLNAGAVVAGNTDGAGGGSGDATANMPWALATDASNNIYWTDYGTQRVRMLNQTVSTINFWGATNSPTFGFVFSANDTAGAWATASLTIQGITVSGSAGNLSIVGPSKVVTGNCSYYKAQLRNGAMNAYTSGSNTVVTIASGTGSFYSDSGCSTSITSGAMTIPSGSPEVGFFFKNAATTTTTLTLTGGGLTTNTQSVQTLAAAAASRFQVFGPNTFIYNQCLRLTVQAQDASGNPATSGAARTFRMAHNAIGSFYTSSTCSGTPQVQFTLPLGQSEMAVYYASQVVVPASQVGSLIGAASQNTTSPSTTTTVPFGLGTLRAPRGLAIDLNAGVVKGIYVSNYDQHRITYFNNAATSRTMGGTVVPSYEGGLVLGTGTAGFNSDGIGNVTRIWTGYGIATDSGTTTNLLLIPDYDNYRVRSFDPVLSNGTVTTLIGAGRARSGNLGDSPTAAPSMYLSSPGQAVVDSTNRKLYVSDSGNARVRRVDLLTGLVDTIVGKGSGAATVENEDPTNAFMTSPRGLSLMTVSSNPFLVFADQAANTSANQNCMIRAMNLTPNIGSPPASSIFGVSINPFRVSTVVGDYTLGCRAWNTAPANSSGGAGLSTKLYNPEGISSDGTNLYVAVYNDHCIVKVNSSGQVTPIVGTCGTAGLIDGSTASALIRFPTGIVVDPLYAADGNFFFADAVDQNPSRIRYVNFRTGGSGSVDIGSTTVPAATSPNGIVQTIWTVSPSGNSTGRVFGLAAFGSQLCIAGGWPGNGNLGSHNVTCYDRSNPLGPISLRVGANESTSPPYRAGAPLDTSQEGAASTSAYVYSPYGLAFDSAGNLYISERSNHIVRMVRRWW